MQKQLLYNKYTTVSFKCTFEKIIFHVNVKMVTFSSWFFNWKIISSDKTVNKKTGTLEWF